MEKPLNKAICRSVLVVVIAMLAACGGSSGNKKTTDAHSVSGTAAKGAAITGTVHVVSADGTPSETVTISDKGTYSINVDGLQGPFLVVAHDNDTNADLYSYAESGGVVANVTPLTDLALKFCNSDISALSWPASLDMVKNWNGDFSDCVRYGEAKVYTELENDFVDNGLGINSYNIITKPFAVNGKGMDALLDNIDTIEFENTLWPYHFVITKKDSSVVEASFEDGLSDSLDFDKDSLIGTADNCPTVSNFSQADFDKDNFNGVILPINLGDACDPDDDNDGVADVEDKCPNTSDYNLSLDKDHDGCDDNDEDIAIDTKWTITIQGHKCTAKNGTPENCEWVDLIELKHVSVQDYNFDQVVKEDVERRFGNPDHIEIYHSMDIGDLVQMDADVSYTSGVSYYLYYEFDLE